jgi:hypothetical protein
MNPRQPTLFFSVFEDKRSRRNADQEQGIFHGTDGCWTNGVASQPSDGKAAPCRAVEFEQLNRS